MSTAKDAFTGRMFRRMLAPALISAVASAEGLRRMKQSLRPVHMHELWEATRL